MIQRLSDNEMSLAEDVLSGLRMTADQFLEICNESENYELINGVVTVTPSPAPIHQHLTGEIFYQIRHFLESHPVGLVFVETDVHLGSDASGDFVYRSEIVFYVGERAIGMEDKLFGPPDLVVEIVSRGSRRLDSETKLRDYERFGVREYWLFDPERHRMTAYLLRDNAFVESPITGDRFSCEAVPGFHLDVARVRRAFRMHS